MAPLVGLHTCTGDPLTCAEADIEALTPLGVKAIINPSPDTRLDAVKISYTKPQGTLGYQAPIVAGPGVEKRMAEMLGASIYVEASKDSVTLLSDGREARIAATGCRSDVVANTAAALAAGYLALGREPGDAVDAAVSYVEESMKYWGCTPRAIASLEARAYRGEVLDQVRKAAEILLESGDVIVRAGLAPEVGINIAMAIPQPYARGPMDVAAIPGRIRRAGLRLVAATTCPEMGASSHLARAILEVMKRHPEVRAGVNILYTGKVLEAASRLGYRAAGYDRRMEPPEVKAREGATIPWGVNVALDKLGGGAPDLIYHYGDWGKEPMAIILGRTAVDAVGKTISIASIVSRG